MKEPGTCLMPVRHSQAGTEASGVSSNGHALKGAQRKMKITPTPPSPVEEEGILPAHPDVSTVKRRGIFI